MERFIAFNGDADGICAAHQYLLSNPGEYTPVTGVKRDIALLKKIDNSQPVNIVVFDVAVEKNLVEANRLLDSGSSIQWFDHHVSESIPQYSRFRSVIDTNPDVNTSLIVSRYLERASLWAVVGLFGDNIAETAKSLSNSAGLDLDMIDQLREMGELLNYNAYGSTVDDLHIHPAEVLKGMDGIENPFEFLKASPIIPGLRSGMKEDLEKAFAAKEEAPGIFVFPDEKWARRAIGVFANRKAQSEPEMPHAVLVDKPDEESYTVSVRSPLNSERSAAELCSQFPTGGGRIKAAGINALAKNELSRFVNSFMEHYN